MTYHQTEIAIIGGGLTGLALAYRLHQTGRSFVLLEARHRLGGRILPGLVSDAENGSYDLGPAWIWPHNASLLRLLRELGLQTFDQYATGKLVFQEASGAVRRDLEFAPMAGSLRVDGGLGRLVNALCSSLPTDAVRTGSIVTDIKVSDLGVALRGHVPDKQFSVAAGRAVIALPPRIAETSIRFSPDLPQALRHTFKAIPTWMAGHAKFLAVYETPFWRDMDLSGDAISHVGPMAEIHDASPSDSSEGALFGFLGVDANTRKTLGEEAMKARCVEQLSLLFGPNAASPTRTFWKDWAQDHLTAVQSDWTPPAGHPAYEQPAELSGYSSDRLIFAGTELAPHDGGFLEGAVVSAEAVANRILHLME